MDYFIINISDYDNYEYTKPSLNKYNCVYVVDLFWTNINQN